MTSFSATSRRRLLVCAVAAAFAQAACGGDSPAEPPAQQTASVQVTAPAGPLTAIGATAQLSAVAKDGDGGTITGKTPTWSSSAPDVATVDSHGLVTAVGGGTAEIRAAIDGVQGTAPVQVVQVVASVSIAPARDSLLALQDTLPITATARDANGSPVAGLTFFFSSSNEDVALVSQAPAGDPDAVARIVSVADGSALITAELDGLEASAEITVAQTVADVLITPDTAFVTASDTTRLSALAVDARGNEMAGTIDWSISDGSLAAIDTEGLLSISALATPGEALDVEATTGDVTGSARVRLVLEFESVTGGQNHSCGLTSDGTAYCWGRNLWGMLGDGSNTDRPLPTPVAGGHVFESLSAGSWHTCGIAVSGTSYCWGRNWRGTLGDGTEIERTLPVEVVGGHTFQSVESGDLHTCALTTTGAAYCWGDGRFGQRGDSTAISCGTCVRTETEPVRVAGGHTFVAISAGRLHTCAIDDMNEAYCWGYNPDGQLGRDDVGFLGTLSYPWAVSGGHQFVQIKTTEDHTCALTPAGAAYCWGTNQEGRVGDGTIGGERETPTPVTGGHVFTALHVGTSHACSLRTDGEVYCWGSGMALGNGSDEATGTPVPVAGEHVFLDLYGGTHTTFALDGQDRTFGWGSDSYGATGTGSSISATPEPVRY